VATASSKTHVSLLKGAIAVTVLAYAIYTFSWIAHEIQGGAWVRWLELTYLVALIVWVTGFALVFVVRRRLRQDAPRTIIGDERTGQLFMRAHQVALIVVVLAQIPFFFLAIPTQVLAQFTIATAVIALFASYAWLDR
jgi:uncharacterized membrane protein